MSHHGSSSWRAALVATLVVLIPRVGSALPGDITTYAGANFGPVPLGPRIAATASGAQVYFADSSQHTVRRLDLATQSVSIVAGVGTQGSGGDDGPATAAGLAFPAGIALDTAGDLFIADITRIRRIDGTTARALGFECLGA